jgi:tetratricopeptide (TPR) repeat protein
MGHFAAAETEYQTALKIDPNSSGTHSDYGRLLQEMGCLAAAEMEHQKALETDSRNTYAHEAYAFFLFDKKNIEESLDEMRTVFKLLIGEGDKVGVHLFLAWINETIAEAYYEKGVNRKKKGIFSKSGKFASIAGKEYLLAAENAKDKEQNLYLTKGHTLKGRAAIRQLDLPLFASFKLKINTILHPHSYLELRLIFSRIHEAADNYEKVAEISAEENSTCLACCKCMRILCEVLDFVQAATIQSKVPDIDENIEKWKNELDLVEPFYEDSVKGTNFVQALRKMISSLSSFEKIKSSGRLTSGRELELFSKELTNVIDNIEGPLQDVITKSTEQMKKCAMKWAPYRDATEASVLEDENRLKTVRWILKDPVKSIVTGLIVVIIAAYFGL